MSLLSTTKERLIGSRLEEPLRRIAALRGSDAGNDTNNKLTVEVARRVLRPDSNTVDVGAHRGVILRELIALAPEGTHVAVEPLPRHAAALAKRYSKATVHQIALADTPGTATFRRIVGAAEESSLAGFGHQTGRGTETFEVQVRTLDEIAPDPVHFVKIDAEGAEWLILKGANRVLSQRPVIAFELGANQEQVYTLLTGRGYTVTRLRDWLDGQPAPKDLHALRHEVNGQHFFLAHP